MITIVDYGMGNVRSLSNAFEFFGCDVVVTGDHGAIRESERIVLPGVGAFGDAMDAIRENDLVELLQEQALEQRKPILGICLGMQLFANSSEEHGYHQGLGLIDAEVKRIRVDAPLKVPHVGWNDISFPENDWLFSGLRSDEANFYFVHSYHMVCNDKKDLLATTDYGFPVTAIVRKDNLLAIQFHPEKSQDNGLKILENWVEWEPTC